MAIAALGLVVRLGVLGILGLQPAGDTTVYLRAAEEWARADFRPSWLLGRPNGYSPGYVAFLGLTGAATGPVTALLVQTAVGAFVPALLYLTLRRAGGPKRQAWLAALALVMSYEVARWNGYLLTESLFVTASALALMGVILALRPGGWGWTAGTAVAVLLALFLRPTGLAVALGGLGAAVVWRPWRRGLALGILAVLVVYGAHLWLLPVPASRLLYARGVCWNLVAGRVFWGTDEYGVRPLDDGAAWVGLGVVGCLGRAVITAPWRLIQVVGRRVVAYWMPVYGHYSPRHNLANLMLLGVPLALALVGIWRGAGTLRADPVWLVPLAWAAAFTAQHALTWVEQDHRLLTPALPALYVLAAGGAQQFGRSWSWPFTGWRQGAQTPRELRTDTRREGGGQGRRH